MQFFVHFHVLYPLLDYFFWPIFNTKLLIFGQKRFKSVFKAFIVSVPDVEKYRQESVSPALLSLQKLDDVLMTMFSRQVQGSLPIAIAGLQINAALKILKKEIITQTLRYKNWDFTFLGDAITYTPTALRIWRILLLKSHNLFYPKRTKLLSNLLYTVISGFQIFFKYWVLR